MTSVLAESAPLRRTALALVLSLVAGSALAAASAPSKHHRARHSYTYGHRHGAPVLGPRGLCARGRTVVVPR